MPPRATGTIEPRPWKDGRTVTWMLRVRQDGRRHWVKLGTNHEGWNEDRAQVELDRILDQIRRGTWQPPRAAAVTTATDETFHVTASRWWARRKVELAKTTRADYRWRLDHLLLYLAREYVTAIDTRKVDDVRGKLVGRGLSPRSVNMHLDLLAQILDDAVEAKLIDVNPARGKRRRMKLPKQRRAFLEPDMVIDLLDEAGAWEASLPKHQRYGRRALLAALCLGGFRISELLDAPHGALDLHGGRLRVGDSKTEAGLRDVELTFFLAAELRDHLAHFPAISDRSDKPPYIFHSRTAGRLNASNLRNRLLAGVVERANKRRAEEGQMLLPSRVTPHALRRTFASLCYFEGRDPRFVMQQLGHTDPRLALAVYAQCMSRQSIDRDLVHKLMMFPDEEETHGGRLGSNLKRGSARAART